MADKEAEHVMEQARDIARMIEIDMRGRRGLRQALEQVDAETMIEMRNKWEEYAFLTLLPQTTESLELQRQAVALVKQYGTFLTMAPPVKSFFKRLAVFLKWEKLKEAL